MRVWLGGNGWNSLHEAVFTICKNRLMYLGNISANDDDDDAIILGGAFSNGVFSCTYDKLEANSLTSHVMASSLELFLREKNGRFLVDIDSTWKYNGVYYYQIADSVKQLINSSSDYNFNLMHCILNNSLVAKFCGKSVELKKWKKLVKKYFDVETYKVYLQPLDYVMPGEIPER